MSRFLEHLFGLHVQSTTTCYAFGSCCCGVGALFNKQASSKTTSIPDLSALHGLFQHHTAIADPHLGTLSNFRLINHLDSRRDLLVICLHYDTVVGDLAGDVYATTSPKLLLKRFEDLIQDEENVGKTIQHELLCQP